MFKRLSFRVDQYLHVEVRVQRVVGSVSATEEVAKTGDQKIHQECCGVSTSSPDMDQQVTNVLTSF